MADIIDVHELQPEPFSRENEIPYPRAIEDLIWDEKPKTLKGLVETSRLPFLAKVHSGDLKKHVAEWSHETEDEDAGGILQVIEIRRKKVVVVRKMQWDRKTGDYVTSGKQAEIPATYKGWFEVLPEDGRPVEYFDSIQAITNVKPRRFLIRTLTVGYQLSMGQGNSSWVPYELRPGTVLTTGIIFMDHKKSKTNVKTFFRKFLNKGKNSKKEQDLKYLQCFDNVGAEIMIPLIMSGVFSPIGETAEENFDSVYELQDLILAFNLPVKAQLIHEEDKQRSHIVPHGIVKIEEVKDHDFVVFGKYPLGNGNDKTYEIPTDADVMLQKDLSRKRRNRIKSQPPSVTEIANVGNENDRIYMNTEPTTALELPIRVKEPKKPKQGLLEKLSVRSRNKKERASLKALQEAGVFSSRLSKSEINFEELCKIDYATDDQNSRDAKKEAEDSALRDKGDLPQSRSFDQTSLQSSDKNSNYPYGVFTNPNLLQSRDLPPIPPNDYSHHIEKEAVYEELPVAPKPPDESPPISPMEPHNDSDDDDGYMSPAQLRIRNQQSAQLTRVVVRNKPPVAPSREYAKSLRSRKTRSEVPASFDSYRDYKGGDEIDIDDLFRYSSENDQKCPSESPYSSKPPKGYNMSHTPNITQRQNSLPDYSQQFSDDLRLETRSNTGWQRQKSKSHRSLNVDANATVRSHNMRKIRNAADVFNFNETVQDLKQSRTQLDQPDEMNPSTRYEQNVTSSTDNDRVQYTRTIYRTPFYAESEPGYKRYTRSSSVSGLSDAFSGKQYEDSAISGDYGYNADSEYSYQEYSDYRDDKWTPPDDLSHLTVQEVSKSLHYIGMKDRVVIRLANEQIDGELLCSLDKALLHEGFPELNGLDIKKIVDFINGWRPKKK